MRKDKTWKEYSVDQFNSTDQEQIRKCRWKGNNPRVPSKPEQEPEQHSAHPKDSQHQRARVSTQPPTHSRPQHHFHFPFQSPSRRIQFFFFIPILTPRRNHGGRGERRRTGVTAHAPGDAQSGEGLLWESKGLHRLYQRRSVSTETIKLCFFSSTWFSSFFLILIFLIRIFRFFFFHLF